jgi:adenylosuccinate synthase
MTKINIEPIYEAFAGWNISTSAAKSPGELPEAMKRYVEFINQELGVGIQYISNGPGREQIISLL